MARVGDRAGGEWRERDSAVESESESEAVESGSLVAEATEAESQLTESGSSNNELSPTSELATGALPELAMLEPGAPQLEELEGEPGAQPERHE